VPPEPADPRLDTRYWHILGRRFPRRLNLYVRIFAMLLLLAFLVWWFTRDVTYVSNVKVSGLGSMPAAQQPALRDFAAEFAALVNQLAEHGYAWQSGGLPALRMGDALSAAEREGYLALGTLEVRQGGRDLRRGDTAQALSGYLQGRGWTVTAEAGVHQAHREAGGLRGRLELQQEADGRQRVILGITPG